MKTKKQKETKNKHERLIQKSTLPKNNGCHNYPRKYEKVFGQVERDVHV